MLKEALDWLHARCKESHQGSFLANPGDPKTHYLLTSGGATRLEIPPPLIHFQVDNLADLVLAVEKYSAGKCSLWVSEKRVECLLDDADRRESVTMSIDLHDHFQVLRNFRKPQLLKQAELIHLFRVLLHGVVAEDVIARFRRIDFSRSRTSQSHLNKGQESLGSQVEAHVQGIEELPDGLRLNVRQFANRDLLFSYQIRLLLDARPQEELWQVTAIGEDLDNALAEGLEKIVLGLRADFAESNSAQAAQVFAGAP